MVSAVPDSPGIQLTATELLLLKALDSGPETRRPATRRPGATPARPAGSGMDLREIRAFADGDDARRIDPATTARTGQPHVRSFHEDRDDTLLLVADFRLPMLWGTGESLRSVRAARALARAGWRAARRSASIAAVVVDGDGVSSLPLAAGHRQMLGIIEMLTSRHRRALSSHGDGPAFDEALTRAVSLAPPGAEVIIATGPEGVSTADEPALARLARRRRVTLRLPLDPVERQPPEDALPIRSGEAARIARMRPFEASALSERLRSLNVTLEVLPDDAG